MRIGLSTSSIDPGLTAGKIDGIGVYTENLLSALKQQPCETIPVVFPPLGKRHARPQWPSSLNFPFSYPVLACASLLTPRAVSLNRRIEREITIFHATDYQVPRFKKIPVVATLHDAIMLKHPQWCNPFMRSLKNKLFKASVRWVDFFIAVSAAAIPELVEYWKVPESKITVIHHGVDDFWLQSITHEAKQQVLDKYHLSPGFLLVVGTLQPRKNLGRLIKAFNQLPLELRKAHKLVIVGKNGFQSDEILNDIHDLVQTGNGVWLDYISQDELRALYQSAKMFLFPSLYEGFGLPVLEAFASKTPVVAANITSIPEIAGNAAYLIDPYNVEEMREAIKSLLNDERLCQHYANLGTERVKQFTWRQCAEKTLAVYEKLCL